MALSDIFRTDICMGAVLKYGPIFNKFGKTTNVAIIFGPTLI